MNRAYLLPVLLMFLSMASPARAQSWNGISVGRPFATETSPDAKSAVVYMTIEDHGAPDTLIGADTAVAASADLNQGQMEDGVLHMDPVDALPLSEGHPLEFRPDNLQIVLTGLKQQLKAGDTFPLTLNFVKAGQQTITVTVRAEEPPQTGIVKDPFAVLQTGPTAGSSGAP